MTERYLIFAGKNGERVGGWGDFLSEAPDLDVAQEVITSHIARGDVVFHWYHVVDLEYNKIVKVLGSPPVSTSTHLLGRRGGNDF